MEATIDEITTSHQGALPHGRQFLHGKAILRHLQRNQEYIQQLPRATRMAGSHCPQVQSPAHRFL